MSALRSAAWPDQMRMAEDAEDDAADTEVAQSASCTVVAAQMEATAADWVGTSESDVIAPSVPGEADVIQCDETASPPAAIAPPHEELETLAMIERPVHGMNTSRTVPVPAMQGLQPGERLPDTSGVFQETFRAYAGRSRKKLRRHREAMDIRNAPASRVLPDTSAVFATTFRAFRQQRGRGQGSS